MQLTAEQPQNSQYYSLFPSNKSYSRKEYKLACGTLTAASKLPLPKTQTPAPSCIVSRLITVTSERIKRLPAERLLPASKNSAEKSNTCAVVHCFPFNKSYFRKESNACRRSICRQTQTFLGVVALYVSKGTLGFAFRNGRCPQNVKGIYLSIKIRFKNQRKPLPFMLTKQTKRSNCPALGTNCSLFFYQSSRTSVFTSE